jgi:hypothetical protein
MSDARRHAHELIDRLLETQLPSVAGLLEAMLGREEIGETEERAVDEAKRWLRENCGKGIPHAEVLTDFGLSEDRFNRMGEDRAQRRHG